MNCSPLSSICSLHPFLDLHSVYIINTFGLFDLTLNCPAFIKANVLSHMRRLQFIVRTRFLNLHHNQHSPKSECSYPSVHVIHNDGGGGGGGGKKKGKKKGGGGRRKEKKK